MQYGNAIDYPIRKCTQILDEYSKLLYENKKNSLINTCISELRQPLRASILHAHSLVKVPILRYWSQGCQYLNLPCLGSHFAKFTYNNHY